MKTSNAIAVVLLALVNSFIVFYYIPSQLQLSAFATESNILMNVVIKQTELERLLSEKNTRLESQLASLREKPASSPQQELQKAPPAVSRKPGNRGFFKKGKQ